MTRTLLRPPFSKSDSKFGERFLAWVDVARLEEKTKKFYRNGWRLLKATPVSDMRLDQITGDCAEQLKFPGSAANANCALRTLRRMLHKAEEWKMIGHAPKIKMMKERGRHLRLDGDAERRLLEGSKRLRHARGEAGLRALPRHRDLDARHGDEKTKGTLPRTDRESRLGKSRDLRAGQQNSRRCDDLFP